MKIFKNVAFVDRVTTLPTIESEVKWIWTIRGKWHRQPLVNFQWWYFWVHWIFSSHHSFLLGIQKYRIEISFGLWQVLLVLSSDLFFWQVTCKYGPDCIWRNTPIITPHTLMTLQTAKTEIGWRTNSKPFLHHVFQSKYISGHRKISKSTEMIAKKSKIGAAGRTDDPSLHV